MLILYKAELDKGFVRDDYCELIELCLIFLRGHTQKKLKLRSPGVMPWFEYTMATNASNQDLRFLKKLKEHEKADAIISKASITKFSHYLWYLCELTVILLLYDEEVDSQIMKKMIANFNSDRISDFSKRHDPTEEELAQKLFGKLN